MHILQYAIIPLYYPFLQHTLQASNIIRTKTGTVISISDPLDQRDGFDVVTLEQHLATVFSIIINAEFKLQQYQVFS